MQLSNHEYKISLTMDNNPEDLQQIITTINDQLRVDKVISSAGLSIDKKSVFYRMPDGALRVNAMLKSGYQSLISRVGVPYRLASTMPEHLEIPLINGLLTAENQRCVVADKVMVRLINNEVRAVLSGSYTAINDLDILGMIERTFLPRIARVDYNSDHMHSNTRLRTRNQESGTYHGYQVDMFLYIENSEIGDASVKCGVGISIARNINELGISRTLYIPFAQDVRTLGKVIHRGDAIKKIEKTIDNLFERSAANWDLIQVALRRMSELNMETLILFEDRLIKSLQTMPEFNVWKESYTKMREATVISNAFDLIYLMTSIPYRDESFNTVVEEIIFGQLF